MDKNLALDIGLKGQLALNAQAVPLQEGYLKLGGIVDATETNGLKFGLVVSADADAPDSFVKGQSGSNVVRGVCVFDDAIAQNAPAHPDKYLCGMPCAVLNHGFMWLSEWDTAESTEITPVIGCKVIFNTTSGVIGFIASGASVPDGYAELSDADVRSVDADNGALIYLN